MDRPAESSILSISTYGLTMVGEIPKTERLQSLTVSEHLAQSSNERSLSEDFGRALVQSAVVNPIKAVVQPFSPKAAESLSVIKSPEAEFNSSRFWAQQAGTALGMAATFWVAGKCVKGITRQGLTDLQLARSTSEQGILGLTLKEAALTGLAHDTLLKPAEDKHATNLTDLTFARIANGVTGAITMTSLTAAAIGMKSLAKNLSVSRPGLAAVVGNDLFSGAISGGGASVIGINAHSLLTEHKLASLEDTGKSAYTMAVFGTAFGALHRWNEGPQRAGIESLKRDLELASKELRPANERRGQVVAVEDLQYRELVSLKDTRAAIASVTETEYVMPRLKEGVRAKDFGSDAEFMKDAIVNETEAMLSYRFRGIDSEVLVAKDYAERLEPVRQLRLKYGDDLSVIPQKAFEEFRVTRDFAKRALPEDLVPALEAQPDQTTSRRVIISGRENPEDAWRRLSDPDFTSVATSGRHDNSIRLYRPERNLFLREDVLHEWSHLLYYGNSEHRALFDAANLIESDGYFTRDYANLNVKENWAVNLSENFLSPTGKVADGFFRNAPVRTLVMAEALRTSITNARQPSLLSDAYLSRIQSAEEIARPLATKQLSEMVASGNAGKEALWLLLRYGEDLSGLKHLETANLSELPVGDTEVARLATIPGLKNADLSFTRVSADVGRHLLSAKDLEVLILRGTSVTNTTMSWLAKLPRLRSLDVSNTTVSDGGVTPLAMYSPLTELITTGSRITPVINVALQNRNSPIKIVR